MKRKFIQCFACTALLALSAPAQTYDGNSINDNYAPDGVIFRVADKDWNPDSLGNHRAVVNVPLELDSKVIKTELKWRRPDLNPENKDIIIIGATTGKYCKHVYMEKCSAEEGTILFEPVNGEQTYFVYYMPYRLRYSYGDGRYEPKWDDYYHYDAVKGKDWYQSVVNLKPTKGIVTLYESRNSFEFLTQMGNIATNAETQNILSRHTENPIIFTEDRCFPIRLTEQIPVRWVNKEPEDAFEGTALRNEYYVWQIGLWAARSDLNNVKLTFSDLKQVNGDSCIKAKEMTCFNQEGINWDGSPLNFNIQVPKGNIQALWCGVQVPYNIPVGIYKGRVVMSADGMTERTINVTLNIQEKMLADKGDNDLWRMSRLRWLNSRIGSDFNPIAPFKALKIHGNNITATEKNVKLDRNGMLQSICVNNHEVLSRPMAFEVETDNGTLLFNSGVLKTQKEADGLVTWTSEQVLNGVKLQCNAQMEYDGHLNYKLNVSSINNLKVKDIRIVTYYTEYAQKYMMGVGFVGGLRPKEHIWNWEGLFDSYWMGGTKAGLHMEFLGDVYHGPLLRDYRTTPPSSWYNKGKGRIIVKGEQEACVTASIGEMELTNKPFTLEFALDITPTKPVDTRKQFSMRFFHNNWRNFDKAAEDGANICNLHHATDLNPVINYPFIVQEPLKRFIKHEHKVNRKVKLYYTIRELTNHTQEIYALNSLGTEILQKGYKNGAPWLCEHLINDFRPAWYTRLENGIVDAAVVLSPQSRWINYYLEGLRWMLQNYEIDGLYMDDVSFDRNVMKRIRKVMAEYRPDALIDLHSHDGYSAGPSNSYTDFFPYIDRIWFGEGFKYNEMDPYRWLVTFSGIPFGPMSEMLEDGGNPYLGAVFGTTDRHSYGPTPAYIWKLWKEFDIENAQMLGFWDENAPVTTSDPEVKTTAFIHKGKKALISVGNFSKEEKSVYLTFDWKTFKLNPQKVSIKAPEVKDFQSAQSFRLDQPLKIKAKEGYMLIVE